MAIRARISVLMGSNVVVSDLPVASFVFVVASVKYVVIGSVLGAVVAISSVVIGVGVAVTVEGPRLIEALDIKEVMVDISDLLGTIDVKLLVELASKS